MKAVYQLVGLALLLLVSSSIVLGDSNTCGTTLAPCKTNPTNAYMACVSQDFISQVSAYLPESVPVPESLINPSDWNANVFYNFSTLASQSGKKVTDFQAYINVTILWEGAGYRNQFGYFLFNYDSHGNPQIRTDKHGNKQQFKLFTDVSFPNAGDPGACLQSGVSVDIGPFVDGDNVGFACWPDGYNTNSHPTLYTANKLNPNNAVHVFMFSIDDKYIIGMEDIDPLSSSDRDYNDIVFQFQTTLDATINVPVLDSCPDPTCGGTGHGVCNSTTKTCTCSSSASLTYYGDDCQYSYTCTCQQGVCIGNGECSCNTDKFGADCSSCAAGRYNYPDCKTCDNYCDTDKGYTCDPSGNCIAPVPPPNPTPYCLTAPFGVASDYLAFVRADFNGENSDIQGRLAAGGDVDLFQYSLAEALNPTDDDTLGCQDITPSWAAVAVGDFTFSSGNARIGSLAVGGNNEIDPSVSSGLAPDCSVVPTDQAVDVESNFDFLFGLSDALSNLDDNGNVYSTKDSKTTLVFAAPNHQPDDYNFVFELDASDLSAADSVILNNFQGMQVKAIVINVDVTKYEFKDTSFSDILAGSSQYLASKIIWNFYNAHTITIDSIAIPGYLLAPGANVKGTNGVLNGALFANSFEGDLQFNYPVGSEGLCIMSNFHIDIGDAPCPPCDDGATPGKGCRCECENACPHGKFADPFGSCACICPIDNDCVLGQDPDTCLCLGTTPASSDGSCSGSYDGIAWPSWLTDFQIVTAGDLTLKATRVGGRVAGGGTTTLKRIAVGNDLPQSKNYDCTSTNGQEVAGVVLANGPLNFKSGSVTGNILFGDYTQIAEYLSFPQVVKSGVVGCNLPQSAVADLASNWNFANAFTALQAYSDAIAQASVTGQSYFAFDVLTFWGYNRTVEVFRVDNDDLNSARRIDVSNVRADATIIIDITGHSVSIKDVGIASLLPWGGALIWNAANANTFSFKNVALPGLILAPGADISNPVGRLVGGAFVNSFSASGNVALEWPVPNWAGCLPAADLITASCADCPAGSIRSSASTCDCDAVVTITQNSVSIFEGNNGALVTFGISVIGRAPSGVTINFPNDGTCTLQLNKGTPNVFSLNKISNPSGTTGFTYQTPNYAGFSAAAYSFVTVFQGSTINSCLTVPTPTILSVEWDPIN